MTMKESDIRKYAGLMKELELTGLEVKEDNFTMRLERSGGQVLQVATPVAGVPSAVPTVEVGPAADYISVRSPLVGTFYASPTERADAFVHVGDVVKRGSTLCIIEAMKLMNEVTAETDGTILEICVQNGQVVEYGSELFRIGR